MQFRQTQLLVLYTLNMVIFLKTAPNNSKFLNINVNITYHLRSKYRSLFSSRSPPRKNKQDTVKVKIAPAQEASPWYTLIQKLRSIREMLQTCALYCDGAIVLKIINVTVLEWHVNDTFS